MKKIGLALLIIFISGCVGQTGLESLFPDKLSSNLKIVTRQYVYIPLSDYTSRGYNVEEIGLVKTAYTEYRNSSVRMDMQIFECVDESYADSCYNFVKDATKEFYEDVSYKTTEFNGHEATIVSTYVEGKHGKFVVWKYKNYIIMIGRYYITDENLILEAAASTGY